MVCNRCGEIYDVMLKWHTRVTERKGMGEGGERERELSFRIQINEGWGRGGGWSPALEYKGFQLQTSQGMNRKTRILRGKNPLIRCRQNPIDVKLMRVSLLSKLRKTKQPYKKIYKKRKERDRQTEIQNLMTVYTHSLCTLSISPFLVPGTKMRMGHFFHAFCFSR